MSTDMVESLLELIKSTLESGEDVLVCRGSASSVFTRNISAEDEIQQLVKI